MVPIRSWTLRARVCCIEARLLFGVRNIQPWVVDVGICAGLGKSCSIKSPIAALNPHRPSATQCFGSTSYQAMNCWLREDPVRSWMSQRFRRSNLSRSSFCSLLFPSSPRAENADIYIGVQESCAIDQTRAMSHPSVSDIVHW